MKKLAIYLCLAFLFSSCSRSRVVWQFMDNLVAMNLQSKFQWSSTQKQSVREQIDKAKEKIEKKSFPELAQHFTGLANDFQKISANEGIDPLFTKYHQIYEGLLGDTIKTIEPEIMGIAQQIDEKSWQNFKEKYAQENAEILEKGFDFKKRMKSMTGFVEEFTGDLNDAQLQILKDYTLKQEGLAELRVKNRNHMLAEFEKHLGKTPFTVSAATSLWMSQYKKWQDPEYSQRKETQKKEIFEMLKKLYPTLSDAQKKQVPKTALELAGMLNSFSK